MSLKTVRVPAQFEPLFAEAEKTVGKSFRHVHFTPEKGEIRIGGERYVLIRGSPFLAAMLDQMESQFGEEVMKEFVYSLAKTIGRGDAQQFAKQLELLDPIARLSAGPVHLAHTGWAFVEILPQSSPTPDENYVLVYHHPNTFESEHYLAHGRKLQRTTCFFSAGYSAGWCSNSFGLELEAREIRCIAKGDPHCSFVMAPPATLEKRVAEMSSKIG
jgi:hypothetical protein